MTADIQLHVNSEVPAKNLRTRKLDSRSGCRGLSVQLGNQLGHSGLDFFHHVLPFTPHGMSVVLVLILSWSSAIGGDGSVRRLVQLNGLSHDLYCSPGFSFRWKILRYLLGGGLLIRV